MLSVCTLCMYIFFQRGLCFLPCFCFFLLKNKNGAVIDADFLSHYFTCCWPGQAEGDFNDGWLYALLPHQTDENEFSSKTSKYLTLLFFHFQFFMCFSFKVLLLLFFFSLKKKKKDLTTSFSERRAVQDSPTPPVPWPFSLNSTTSLDVKSWRSS